MPVSTWGRAFWKQDPSQNIPSRRHMRLSYISGEVLPPFCGGDACVISETEKDSIQETREEERR